MNDEFKTIKRYPDYEINRKGDVRKRESEKIRKASSINGHPRINLKGNTEYISRLVAETYIPNPDNKTDVLHKDGNKENNSIENLRWATHGENQLLPYGGLGGLVPGGGEQAKKIMINETRKTYSSIRECAREIKGSPSGIRQCLKGQLKTYKGFTFTLIF